MHSGDSGYGKQKPRSDSLQKYRAGLVCMGHSRQNRILLHQHRVGVFLLSTVAPSQQNTLLDAHPALI